MTWRPDLSSVDLADAWFSQRQLDTQRRADDEERAFRHMRARCEYFDAAVAQLKPQTDEERADLWLEADERRLN